MSVVPSTVDANTTVDHDLSYTVTNASNDGNSDTHSITLPNSASFKSTNSLTVTDTNGAEISTGSGASLADANGGTDNQLTFGIQPDSAFDTSSVTVDTNVMVKFQDVSETTRVPITLNVSDSTQGDTSAETNVTIEPEDAVSGPEIPDMSSELSNAVDADNNGEVSRTELRGAVQGYVQNEEVNGVAITRGDLRSIVQFYVQS
ncbi:hypothetical protein DJ71_10750 [Halorubrum sp. E3]|nr:hypothetical protein DJ71_10750 [Halorubrum sp. E3]